MAPRRAHRRRRRSALSWLAGASALVFALGAAAAARGIESGHGRRAATVAAGPLATTPPEPSTTPTTPTTVMPSTTTTTADAGTLPQTRDRPSGTDPAFVARMQLLAQAVASGDTSVALPAFFPLHAYVQVKAVPNPAADWQDRLVTLYDRDITGLHAALGAGAASLQFSGVDVPDGAAQWLGPGAEYNRIGYWRVFNTRVRYTTASGSGSFIVISLISWRGQWYVVHFRTPPR